MFVKKFAALIASISFPALDLVDPIPVIFTNNSISISSGTMIPAAANSSSFACNFLGPTGNATGFMIAEVIPAVIAIGKKALFIPCLFGSPNEIFEAPHVVLTPNSSRNLRTSANTCNPAVPMAPIGITNGSTTISCAGIPKSAALLTIFLATSNLTSGSSEIPVSSFDIATTGTLYFFTSGNTSSNRSSSPVTEFNRGRPSAASKPSFNAPGTELSIHSGTSHIA